MTQVVELFKQQSFSFAVNPKTIDQDLQNMINEQHIGKTYYGGIIMRSDVKKKGFIAKSANKKYLYSVSLFIEFEILRIHPGSHLVCSLDSISNRSISNRLITNYKFNIYGKYKKYVYVLITSIEKNEYELSILNSLEKGDFVILKVKNVSLFYDKEIIGANCTISGLIQPVIFQVKQLDKNQMFPEPISDKKMLSNLEMFNMDPVKGKKLILPADIIEGGVYIFTPNGYYEGSSEKYLNGDDAEICIDYLSDQLFKHLQQSKTDWENVLSEYHNIPNNEKQKLILKGISKLSDF